MTTAAPEDPGAGKLELELYKLLKSEAASYFDKLQALWLQKFVLVGAVIAFLVINHEKFNHEKLSVEGHSILLSTGILAIPVLSALLDAKMLEFSLHARAISRFIGSRFLTPSTLPQWEKVLWGLEGSAEDLRIAHLRHVTTTLVTVVPTMVIWLLASIAVAQVTGKEAVWLWLGALGCLVYAFITWLSWRVMWAGTR